MANGSWDYESIVLKFNKKPRARRILVKFLKICHLKIQICDWKSVETLIRQTLPQSVECSKAFSAQTDYANESFIEQTRQRWKKKAWKVSHVLINKLKFAFFYLMKAEKCLHFVADDFCLQIAFNLNINL